MPVMGFLDWFRFARHGADALAPALPPEAWPQLSPWADAGGMGEVIANDLKLTPSTAAVTRAEALTVPAVTKGRSIILGDLAGAPLHLLAAPSAAPADGAASPLPGWLYATGTPGVTPRARMADTLDDFIFRGAALWALTRPAPGAIPTAAAHVHGGLWRIQPGTRIIEVRPHLESEAWRPAPADGVVYLPGPQDALTAIGAATIRGALDLERSWHGRARSPLPAIMLEDQGTYPLAPAEARKLVREVARARLDPYGAVMYIPPGIKANMSAAGVATDLLTAGRNAVALDIARLLNLPSSSLDATLDKSSLTYETQQGTSSEIRRRLRFWAEPIEDRLSADDLVPPGFRVRFDLSTPGSLGPNAED